MSSFTAPDEDNPPAMGSPTASSKAPSNANLPTPTLPTAMSSAAGLIDGDHQSIHQDVSGTNHSANPLPSAAPSTPAETPHQNAQRQGWNSRWTGIIQDIYTSLPPTDTPEQRRDAATSALTAYLLGRAPETPGNNPQYSCIHRAADIARQYFPADQQPPAPDERQLLRSASLFAAFMLTRMPENPGSTGADREGGPGGTGSAAVATGTSGGGTAEERNGTDAEVQARSAGNQHTASTAGEIAPCGDRGGDDGDAAGPFVLGGSTRAKEDNAERTNDRLVITRERKQNNGDSATGVRFVALPEDELHALHKQQTTSDDTKTHHFPGTHGKNPSSNPDLAADANRPAITSPRSPSVAHPALPASSRFGLTHAALDCRSEPATSPTHAAFEIFSRGASPPAPPDAFSAWREHPPASSSASSPEPSLDGSAEDGQDVARGGEDADIASVLELLVGFAISGAAEVHAGEKAPVPSDVSEAAADDGGAQTQLSHWLLVAWCWERAQWVTSDGGAVPIWSLATVYRRLDVARRYAIRVRPAKRRTLDEHAMRKMRKVSQCEGPEEKFVLCEERVEITPGMMYLCALVAGLGGAGIRGEDVARRVEGGRYAEVGYEFIRCWVRCFGGEGKRGGAEDAD